MDLNKCGCLAVRITRSFVNELKQKLYSSFAIDGVITCNQVKGYHFIKISRTVWKGKNTYIFLLMNVYENDLAQFKMSVQRTKLMAIDTVFHQ